MVHLTAANYHVNDNNLNWLLLFFNQTGRFGTPLFAIISGFLLYNQVIKGKYDFSRFVSSRISKIVIPFIIWSIFYLFFKSYSFPELNDIEGLKKLLYTFAIGRSNYHLYFIAVVIQFYFIFAFVQRFHSKKQLLFLTILSLYINYFSITMSPDLGAGYFNQFLHERTFIFKWIFYFFFGGLLVHYWQHITWFIKKNKLFTISLMVIPFAFKVYEYGMTGYVFSATRPINLISVPVVMLAIISVYYLTGSFQRLRNLVLQIGNMSMGIYLVHPLIIYFLRDEMTILVERTRWIPIAFFITVAMSMLIVKLINLLPFGQYIVIVARDRKK